MTTAALPIPVGTTGPHPCAECGAPMVLRSTIKYVYASRSPRLFYGCTRWPQCSGAHGAHPDGQPLGIPADRETRIARIAAHDAFDSLWKRDGGRRMSRRDAYRLMQHLMGMREDEAHIGRFTAEQCKELIDRLTRHFEHQGGGR